MEFGVSIGEDVDVMMLETGFTVEFITVCRMTVIGSRGRSIQKS
jgi:hypothetical protein